MSTSCAFRKYVVSLAAVATIFAGGYQAQVSAQQQVAPEVPDQVVSLPGKITLADLVELAASARELNIEYDPGKLRSELTLRVREPVSPAELWEITVALLESRSLVVVQTDVEGLWRIVEQQAAKEHGLVPRVVAPASALDRAGDVSSYVSALVRLETSDVAAVKKAMDPLLSKPDNAKPIGDALPGGGSLLLITDVKRRVEAALEIIAMFDQPGPRIETPVITLDHLTAERLSETLEQIAAAETAAAGGTLGSMTGVQTVPFGSAADGRERVLILASAPKQAMVRGIIDELDIAPTAVTRTYSVAGLGADELAQAITAVLGLGAQQREGSATNVVAERWTGAVLVHAPPRQHEAVRDLLARIEQAPEGSRRELASFTILNRDAEDLLTVLESLLKHPPLPPGRLLAVPGSRPPRCPAPATHRR